MDILPAVTAPTYLFRAAPQAAAESFGSTNSRQLKNSTLSRTDAHRRCPCRFTGIRDTVESDEMTTICAVAIADGIRMIWVPTKG